MDKPYKIEYTELTANRHTPPAYTVVRNDGVCYRSKPYKEVVDAMTLREDLNIAWQTGRESQAARIAELEAVVVGLRSLPDPAMQTEPEYGWSDLAEEILGHSWSDIQQEQQDLIRGTCVRLMRDVGWVMCGVYATSATHWQWYSCDVNGYVPRKVHTNIHGEARCYLDMLKHAGVLR